jgi:hypothetical protein
MKFSSKFQINLSRNGGENYIQSDKTPLKSL